MEQANDNDPVIVVIGADSSRCARLAYPFVQEGYEVFIPETEREIPWAISRIPVLILLDYTPATYIAGMTVATITRYLSGDEPGCAPPLLVMATADMQPLVPRRPNVERILPPSSLDLLVEVARRHIRW
jgi:hypothetical protein